MSEVYIPVWNRPPNKLVRYEERPFTLPANAYGKIKSGIEKFAIFKDKNGKDQEMQAFIRWVDEYKIPKSAKNDIQE